MNENEIETKAINSDAPKLKIERLYVKEISCKIPHAPELFDSPEFKGDTLQIEPKLEINIKTQPLSSNKFEVTLHAIINGKYKNLSLFNIEVQQAGIFSIDAPPSLLEQVIKGYCVSILHPYLNQVISNTAIQAGFPPIILQPIINTQKPNEAEHAWP